MAVLLHEQTPDYVTGTLRIGSETVMQACPAREFRPGQFGRMPRLNAGEQLILRTWLLRPTAEADPSEVSPVVCTPTVRLLVYGGSGDWKPSCRLVSEPKAAISWQVPPTVDLDVDRGETSRHATCYVCSATAIGSWRCVDRGGSLYDINVCGQCQPTELSDIDMKIDGTFRPVASDTGIFGGR